jgi:ParB/RepB/Spo0J family partition protein
MNAVIRPSKSISLTFDQIDFPANARPTNAMDVVALVSSIRAIGLQVPLTVIECGGQYLLIAGRHRLEVLRVIGEERVPARVVDFDDIEARLWTISENLHRTALTVSERAEQIAEYVKLTKERMEAQKQAVDQRPARP